MRFASARAPAGWRVASDSAHAERSVAPGPKTARRSKPDRLHSRESARVEPCPGDESPCALVIERVIPHGGVPGAAHLRPLPAIAGKDSPMSVTERRRQLAEWERTRVPLLHIVYHVSQAGLALSLTLSSSPPSWSCSSVSGCVSALSSSPLDASAYDASACLPPFRLSRAPPMSLSPPALGMLSRSPTPDPWTATAAAASARSAAPMSHPSTECERWPDGSRGSCCVYIFYVPLVDVLADERLLLERLSEDGMRPSMSTYQTVAPDADDPTAEGLFPDASPPTDGGCDGSGNLEDSDREPTAGDREAQRATRRESGMNAPLSGDVRERVVHARSNARDGTHWTWWDAPATRRQFRRYCFRIHEVGPVSANVHRTYCFTS
jgi:hypothetical protein